MNHLLEIERNAEGVNLAYLSPKNEKGETDGCYRIAGPKAWGGSVSIAKLNISDDDLFTYVNEYAPEVFNRIKGVTK